MNTIEAVGYILEFLYDLFGTITRFFPRAERKLNKLHEAVETVLNKILEVHNDE